MLKEVCFAVESREGKAVGALAICALPSPLHNWFTTEVLDIGNGDRERVLSQEQVVLLAKAIYAWLEVDKTKQILEENEAEALEKTLMIIEGIEQLSNKSIVNFSNFSRGDE
jgi:hypothetical protein